MTSGANCCDLCGAEVGGVRPWLLLNRYAVGTLDERMLIECQNDGDYAWEMGMDGVEKQQASGWILCWPECAVQWIEGAMLKTTFEMKMQAEDGSADE